MSELRQATILVGAHVFGTGYASLVFTLGFFSSLTVVKYRIEPLMVFPRWVARKIQRLVLLPSPLLFLVIFGFNGLAICAYMLTGLLHYAVPAMIAFLTGTNLGVVLFLGTTTIPGGPVQARGPGRRQFWAVVCGLVTALLELPAFWIAIAMGMTLGGFGGPVDDLRSAALARLSAYVRLIAPVLMVSAAVETLGIRLMPANDRKEEDD